MSEGIHLDQSLDNEKESQSPGHHFSILFQSMQDLFEKLSILKYSSEFCTEYKCRPIHRLVFDLSLFMSFTHTNVSCNDIRS
jgi:hypothetical protein